MAAARPTLIVCEQTGHWASAIRRLFSPAAPAAVRAASEDTASAEETGTERQDRLVATPKIRHGDDALAADYRIIETRTTENCLSELARSPAALVAVELSGDTRERALELLSTIAERYPAASAVVLADRRMRSYEWIARELGAIHFVASPRQLAPLATIAGKRWKRFRPSSDASQENERSVEEIWRSLPWG
ncbi:MAG TPA: hypothetical protein VGJ26_15230 [Pirellulales bacterium]